MALCSPYFEELFFDEPAEFKSEEITIPNVNPNHFMRLLTVIYPPNKEVTGNFLFFFFDPFVDANVEVLTKMAHLFKVSDVLEGCEKRLLASDVISDPKKLLLVDQCESMSVRTKVGVYFDFKSRLG